MSIPVSIEFGGGAEFLYGNGRKQSTTLPEKKLGWTIGDLLNWLREHSPIDRPELFAEDHSVRPGILVLVNDVDWELLDTVNYVLEPNDEILFISSLHENIDDKKPKNFR